MPNDTLHLIGSDGNPLCDVDGPAVSASALMQGAGDVAELLPSFCVVCARAVLAPIVVLVHSRCGGDGNEGTDAHELLQAILCLATTPPGEEAAVLHIMGDALAELVGYIDDAQADHA